jgi:A/G-specific adenine glycosylase
MNFSDISRQKISYLRKQLIGWAKANFVEFPWRTTQNKWHALVAEIMLQRTRAEQVVPVYIRFSDKYQTPSDYLKNPDADMLAPLGLKWRTDKLTLLAKQLNQKQIPSDKIGLLQLHGVGPYIASAYLSLHLNIRDYIIDSNIVRLYGRYFGFQTNGETRRKKWFIELADTLTPKLKFRNYNYGLIDYTRIICKPRPDCTVCILKFKCAYFQGEHNLRA